MPSRKENGRSGAAPALTVRREEPFFCGPLRWAELAKDLKKDLKVSWLTAFGALSALGYLATKKDRIEGPGAIARLEDELQWDRHGARGLLAMALARHGEVLGDDDQGFDIVEAIHYEAMRAKTREQGRLRVERFRQRQAELKAERARVERESTRGEGGRGSHPGVSEPPAETHEIPRYEPACNALQTRKTKDYRLETIETAPTAWSDASVEAEKPAVAVGESSVGPLSSEQDGLCQDSEGGVCRHCLGFTEYAAADECVACFEAAKAPPVAEVMVDEPKVEAAGDLAPATWERVLAAIREEGKTYALSWLERLAPLGIEGEELVLAVQDRLLRDWVDVHYRKTLESTLEHLADGPTRVRFEVVVPRADPVAAARLAAELEAKRVAELERERVRTGIRDIPTFLAAWKVCRAEAQRYWAERGSSLVVPPEGHPALEDAFKLKDLLATEGQAGSVAVFMAIEDYLRDMAFADRRWPLRVFLSYKNNEWRVAASRIRNAAAALEERASATG